VPSVVAVPVVCAVPVVDARPLVCEVPWVSVLPWLLLVPRVSPLLFSLAPSISVQVSLIFILRRTVWKLFALVK